MDRFPSLARGAIDEDVDPEGERVDEPDRLQGLLHPVEIGPRHEQVDIDRRPHGGWVDPGHPGRDGMAAHDGVGNAPGLEGRHCPPEPFLDHGDRLLDPIEDIEPERHDVGIGWR